jgi:type I restriction enzyme S subunit
LVREDYTPNGIPVIRGTNLPADSRFSFDDFVFVTEAKVSRDLASNLAFPGDIVVTQRGTLGQVGLIPMASPYSKFVLSQSQMKLAVEPAKADPQFVYYALKSPLGQHEIRSRAITAGVPHINLALFQNLRVPLPALPTQRQIVGVLSAYDDLIENTNRRIGILEEMTQRIYREWFVEFRYPGHEEVRLAESQLGLVPEGWQIGTLGDLFTLQRGFDLPTNDRLPGKVPVLAATGKHGTHSVAAARGPGVVTGRSGSLGVVTYVGEDYWPLNTTLWTKELRRATAELTYFILADLDLKTFDSGAAVPTLNRNDIANLPRVLPPAGLVTKFSRFAQEVFRTESVLKAAIDKLRATRDVLLPRLISGEIEVQDLDIVMPDVAA